MFSRPSRPPSAHRRSTVLAAAILLAVTGCHEGPVDPADRVQSIEIVSPNLAQPLVFTEGQSISMQVRASDARGEAVAGAALTFQVVDGGGSVAPSEVVTDESGMAAVTYTPGVGENAMEMAASGMREPVRFAIVAQRRVRVDFQEDSVKLAGFGCDHTFFARVLDQDQLALGSSVQFSVTQEGVVSLFPVTSVTGSYRAMLAHAFAATPGTTQLIATHGSGAADTATIEVGDAPPTVRIGDQVIASGSTFSGSAEERSACGGALFRYLNPPPTTFSSLAPEVIRVERVGTGADFTVAGLKQGTALMEARFFGVADTARIEVRDVILEPADTTIRVGESVHYRSLVSDSTGALIPGAANWFSSDSTIARMPEAGVYQGLAVGVDTVTAWTSSIWGARRTAVLRVVAP